MKTTMRMTDLKKKDRFPSDIDRSKTVVVAIREHDDMVILYTDKDGDLRHVMTKTIFPKFATGLYIIKP